MQNSSSPSQILLAILRASGACRPISRQRLALQLRLPLFEIDAGVAVLERRGLVDGSRLRLTLTGLAVAVASGSRRERRAREQAAVPPVARRRRAA